MKILILSTETKHHTYFINMLEKQYDICSIVYERKKLEKPYVTGPFFKQEEDEYENKFFDEISSTISSTLDKKTISVYSINNNHIKEYIKSLAPDIAISFGTGLIKPYIFKIPKHGTINVHRGYIQDYRGLDSDLWAIYNNEFSKIGVTIHVVDENLDTGAILAQENLIISKDDEVYHMRYRTTIVATRLVSNVLSNIENKCFNYCQQEIAGKYYSAMSLSDKHVAAKRLQQYKESL